VNKKHDKSNGYGAFPDGRPVTDVDVER